MSVALWLDMGVGLGSLLAALLLLNSFRHLRRLRVGRSAFHGMSGLLLGCIVAIILLVGMNLLTYARFTAEQPVATIRFRKFSPQHFAVTLTRPEGHVVRTTLAGDEWELEARIIKWTGIATLIGFQPLYRLQRLSGRYTRIEEARSHLPSVASLAKEPGINLWDLAHRESGWLPFVDATYGTGVFLPMHDGARYRVSLSVTGLLARPANTAAEKAVREWQ